MPRPHTVRSIALAVLFGISMPAAAQEAAHSHGGSSSGQATDIGRLGRVEFANSGSAAAQAPFLRGMALMHSFLFEEARDAFREAQRVDPGFAMAYVGDLMSISELEEGYDSTTAGQILQRLGPTPEARLARAPTQREKDYLVLAERYAGYTPEAWDSTAYRRYADDWRTLHERYPDDDDATLFYMLALSSRVWDLLDDPEASLRVSVQAAALGEEVFLRRPDHPGAAHYLIHVYDDARLAPLGLRAARTYARIAPGAHHALHMPSHIFFQFGLWDEVLDANTRAWAVSKASTQGDVLPVEEWDWHAYDWLHYAYLQQGRHAAARALADSARAWWTPERLVEQDEWGQQRFGNYARMLAVRHALETDDWGAELGDLRTASGGADLLFAARSAAARGDRAAIDVLLARAQAVTDSVEAESPREAGTRRVTLVQLRAIAAQAAGRGEEALTLLRAAADSAEAHPDIHLREGPARANAGNPRLLLGEFLLAAGRPGDALAAYDRALELSPGRSLALLGRARALKTLGRAEEARGAYARLLENWRSADAALPELREAREGAGGPAS